MMRFYDCLTAPSPRRVRMLIAEKGITLETIQVDLAKREQLGEPFQAISHLRTVPVLELDDGTRIFDSVSICTYLDEIFPVPNLSGTNPKERAVIAMWQREMDLNGHSAVAECLRNSSRAFQGRALTGAIDYDQIPELAQRGRQRVRQFFADLDRRLEQSEYVAGERFTIADITAFVAIEFSRVIKETVPDEAAHLIRWRYAVAARPSARA